MGLLAMGVLDSLALVKSVLMVFWVDLRNGVSSSMAFLMLFTLEETALAASLAHPMVASRESGVRTSMKAFWLLFNLFALLLMDSTD